MFVILLQFIILFNPTLEYTSVQKSILQDQLNINANQFVPEETVIGVVGGTVELPCNIPVPSNSRNGEDGIKLVLWFKGDSPRPIYTYDTRGSGENTVRHWSNSTALAGRAFFRSTSSPGNLVLDRVEVQDSGLYKCRVDFLKAPTQIYRVKFEIIIPPHKPRIYDRGKEMAIKLGPYRVGQKVVVSCEAWGGSPAPHLYWWRDHALLDSTFETLTKDKVGNTLILESLERSDLHSVLTCQASNNNLSAPISTSVKIDMHFGPLSVKLVDMVETLSAGKRCEAKCEIVGARPPPRVTWWRGAQQIRENVTTYASPDGNVTLSTVTFIPTLQDSDKFLVCRAADQTTGEGSMEDALKLNIHYTPVAALRLGSSLNGSNIKEGDDVYFECEIRSNPRPYKISWRRNGNTLVQNIGLGVIISNQSLVLQKIARFQSGIYTCLAHNTEGDGVSNPVTLNVRYAPYCQPNQQFVYGVGRNERSSISCEVVSNPSLSLTFQWRFNTSTTSTPISQVKSLLWLNQAEVNVMGSKSSIQYTPRTELDYGNLMCWATNSVGVQRDPCIFHLIPAGKPDPVHNCTVQAQTVRGMVVSCGSGFDGGLKQTFQLIVRAGNSQVLVRNLTSSQPKFRIDGLRPGQGYVITAYSFNSQGRSESMHLHAFTLKDESPQHIVADPSRQPGSIRFTPLLGLLVAIASGIGLVAFCVVAVVRIQRVKRHRHNTAGGTNSAAQSYTAVAPAPIFTGRGSIQRTKSKANSPDVIPPNQDLFEEEDLAFKQRGSAKYATIGRSITENDCSERGKGFKKNLSRLSQELNYAELTLPRGKGGRGGYQPMQRLASTVTYTQVESSPVHGAGSSSLTTRSASNTTSGRSAGQWDRSSIMKTWSQPRPGSRPGSFYFKQDSSYPNPDSEVQTPLKWTRGNFTEWDPSSGQESTV